MGLDDTGPVGNGWAIAESPYLVVNEPTKLYYGFYSSSATPADAISLVQGGTAYNFTIPEVASASSDYANLASTDGYPYTLTQTTDGGAAVLKFSDGQGDTAEFFDVPRDGSNRPQPFSFGTTNVYGKFFKYAASNGTTVTASYNAQDQLSGELIANPATAAAAQYLFNYVNVTNTLGGSASLLGSVQYQEAPHGTDWGTIRSASYLYYNGTGLDSASPARSVNTSDGRLGDLESVTITDASGNVINQDYYRYYKLTGEQDPSSSNPASATNNESTTGGPSPLQPAYSSQNPYPDNYVFSGLKTVVQGASFDRLAAAVPNYLTTDDSGIQPYVNNFFNDERWDDHGGTDGNPTFGGAGYDGNNALTWNTSYMLGTRYRAVEEIAQGQGCSSCTQGQGTFKYEYAQNYSPGGMGYNTLDYNIWGMKTTEFLPDDTPTNWADNNLEVIYSNEVGQPMLGVQVQVGTTTASLTGMSVGSQVSNGYSITVTANNSFSAGQYVNMLGVLPEMYDGVFKVTSATSTSFTFTLPQTYIGASGTAAPTPYVNTTTPAPGAVTLGAGTATLVVSQQATGFRYDDSGHLIQTFNPSAITGYDDSTMDLFDSGSTYLGLISANSGLITSNQYAGWSFDGRAGITTIGTAVAPSGTTLPTGDTEAAFVEDASWISQVVDVATSGTYTLQFQAARAQSASEELQLLVDGQLQTVNYNGSNNTTIATDFAFHTASASLTLSPGLHTIQILGVGSPNGDDTYGAALVTNATFSGSGSPTLSDGNFQSLALASGYRYNPTNYAISATGTQGGTVAGQIESTSLQQGLQGTAIPQEAWAYFDYTGGGSPIFPLASDTVYGQTNGGNPRTTNYTPTFASGTDFLQSEKVVAPPITAAQNGPALSNTDTANADTNTYVFDSFGNVQWQKDGDGFLTYNSYDPLTGGLLKQIQDVNTNDTGDFSNLPSGWTTPSGGGLELKTLYQVDALGRPTLTTDPNGNQTYIVYIDGHAAGSGGFVNETLVYPGWHQIPNTSTYTTTGPVQVTREYRPAPGAPAGQQAVYDETLTFTAPVESTSTPSGTENIDQTNIQSLSRNQTNNAGQLIETDAYSSPSGLTYSAAQAVLASAVKADNTQAGNYSATIFAYDSRGRLDKTIDPNGTIYRTVYDYLSRVSSRWVGTDDTPASGFWSPTNNTAPSNMVDVEDDVYDSGGVGDSNLTQVTSHVGGGNPDRVTLNLYDWRDRLIATKQGALMSGGTNNLAAETGSGINRLLTYFNLDNTGETLGTYTYAADGLSLGDFTNWTTATDASRLRQLNTSLFDDQGRVYQSFQYSVDPSSGAIGSNLATNAFRDHRGNLIATYAPGGLTTKGVYDGVGRQTESYTTDGGAVNNGGTPLMNWTAAGSVANDVVLEQTDSAYDGNGNLTQTATHQRFSTDPASGASSTGP
ncbi:MAG TPA: hypothetical protein VN541_14855, partial [Tepidisphaeraceae bacterium]|nr:hypothetical protein [Tepidisphaeraceae bacterium]